MNIEQRKKKEKVNIKRDNLQHEKINRLIDIFSSIISDLKKDIFITFINSTLDINGSQPLPFSFQLARQTQTFKYTSSFNLS